jgi:hypothetical protein
VGLFAWNMVDWGPNYAGRMRSSGTSLAADWREDWVGEWRLGSVDAFTVALPVARRIVVDREIHIAALARGVGSHWGSLEVEAIHTGTLGRIVRPRLDLPGIIIFGMVGAAHPRQHLQPLDPQLPPRQELVSVGAP